MEVKLRRRWEETKHEGGGGGDDVEGEKKG